MSENQLILVYDRQISNINERNPNIVKKILFRKVKNAGFGVEKSELRDVLFLSWGFTKRKSRPFGQLFLVSVDFSGML